jgi:CHASE2 domain-containing sensor protein
MGKLVVLKLDGDLKQQGFRVVLEIGQDGQFPDIAMDGHLPSDPDLAAHLSQWQADYQRLAMPVRILKPHRIKYDGSINPVEACSQSAIRLVRQLQSWLRSDSFREVDSQLRQALTLEESIRILLRTENRQLHRLPWHLWDVLEQHPKAELALGAPRFRRPLPRPSHPQPIKDGVRILAVLGDRRNIDIEADQRMLAGLPGADLTVLVEPSRRLLHDQLCEQPWDILFFAGHSETTDEGQGWIKLNVDVSLTIEELKYGVSRAIANGLQLAIFNSCDGLGLAHALEELQLPQMIVMRESVPDPVAQEFLKYFLKAFARGESFYLAEREARERLQGLEDEFPCASWLPIIYQHPAKTPPDWRGLLEKPQVQMSELPAVEQTRPAVVGNNKSCAEQPHRRTPLSSWRRFRIAMTTSVIITSLLMGVRFLGALQAVELKALDYLLRSRPAEVSEPRILVVEVTQNDTNKYGYPLDDATLAKLIQKLAQFQPRVIGLDMHRYVPQNQGREQFIVQFQQYPNLLTVCSFGSIAKHHNPPAEFSEEQLVNQVGFSDLVPDEGDVIRRQLLSYTPQLAESPSSCSTPYSLSLQLAFQFLDQAGIQPLDVNTNGDWQFGTVAFQKLTSHFGGYQQLDGHSSQILINYRSNPPGQQVTLNQVLQGQVDSSVVQDRVVLIGTTALVARDRFDTPYGEMPGVWIHAHMVSQMLSAVIDGRPLIWSLPHWGALQWGDTLWVLGWSIVGGSLAWRCRSWWLLGVANAIAALMLYQICLAILVQGGWLPLIPSLLSLWLTSNILKASR